MIEFTVGPFAQVGKNLEDFGMNIYFSYVFDESVKQHQKLQEEYIEAFLDNDPAKMARKDVELAMCEGTFELAGAMLYDLEEEEFS
jgi:hypothetical protein